MPTILTAGTDKHGRAAVALRATDRLDRPVTGRAPPIEPGAIPVLHHHRRHLWVGQQAPHLAAGSELVEAALSAHGRWLVILDPERAPRGSAQC